MDNKIAQLTNAVYKLLEYFPESDPLKNRAKDNALAIMSACGESPEGGENFIQNNIDILLNYLSIGKSQGWLSPLNYLIVVNEYKKIKNDIRPAMKIAKAQAIPLYEVTERQKNILEFLNKNEKAQVMELQTALGNVTKRTIRRDLDGLLQAGKVARFGEFNQVFYKLIDRTG